AIYRKKSEEVYTTIFFIKKKILDAATSHLI
ncbi:hypothetical protein Mgra_00004590, partial [Meloidogyne graminicola]